MSITVEPMLKRIQHWKLRQNMVLTLFLNAWYAMTVEEKERIPLTVKQGERWYVVDSEGNEVCEYSMIDSMPFVHWYRTFEDYERIDQIGREYGNTETAGDDDSTGDGRGTEDETAV